MPAEPTIRARSEGPSAAEALLTGQQQVLEAIVRGRPLAEILDQLCRLVESQASRPVEAAILLVDGAGLAHLPLGLGPRAAWSQPILSASGQVLGTFVTCFDEVGEPTAQERGLVDVLARTAALAIERARADEELRAGAARHAFLADLAAATQPLVDPAEVMRVSARQLAEHLGADRCAYAEVEDERVFVITGDHPRGVASIVGRWDVGAFGAACTEAMLAGEPYVVTDAEEDPRLGPEDRPAYRATDIRGVICVPLHKEGRFTAAMAVHQKVPRRWTAAEIDLVRTVVARCWEALERTRVTRTLRESEARYRAIVEATPECVKVVAADGTLLQMNAAGLAMIGATEERSAIGADLYRVIAPEHREAFRALNERVCRGERGTLEFDLLPPGGPRRSMETTAVPLPAGDGGFVQLAIARDVTSRRAAARALAESRARLDYAVRLSGVGFWYCDLPFDVLEWDDRVNEHFWLPAEARVTIDLFYERIHPEDRERTRSAIEASIAGQGPYDVDYRTVDPATGEVKWIRALGGTAYAPDGSPIRFDGVTVDVTARRLEEERLAQALDRERRLLEELRDQDRRKDEFLATLAHELRNPLAPIRTGLEVMRLAGGPPEIAGTRKVMERQVGHMVRMIDDLLDVSRITRGKVTLVRQAVDLRAVLEAALETSRPALEAGAHELAVRMGPDPLPLHVDPTRVAQVLANLLHNAAKYTPDGGQVRVEVERDGGDVVIRVSDTGVGIPRDQIPRVFDMFAQVHRSLERSQGGLGVGLTLARRLVELHGGTLDADSPGPGRGSTFTVRLPLAPETPAVPAGPTAGPPTARPSRVLVVDDNVDGATTMAMLLELHGHHQTCLAHSGPEALARATSFVPDVVLLDIGLPGLDGYAVARRLRSDLESPPVIVAVTGWGAEDDRRKAREAGFDHHLVKPVDPGVLAALLASLPARAR